MVFWQKMTRDKSRIVIDQHSVHTDRTKDLRLLLLLLLLLNLFDLITPRREIKFFKTVQTDLSPPAKIAEPRTNSIKAVMILF